MIPDIRDRYEGAVARVVSFHNAHVKIAVVSTSFLSIFFSEGPFFGHLYSFSLTDLRDL